LKEFEKGFKKKFRRSRKAKDIWRKVGKSAESLKI